MSTVQELVEQLEQLPPTERLKVIDQVIFDTIKPNPEFEQIWVKEASARWEAFGSGDRPLKAYDVVMQKYRKT